MTKNIFLTVAVFLGFCFVLKAQQISTTSNMSLEALIQNTLGQGCVEISNISSSVNGSVDNISSYGKFTKKNSNFPFQDGLILTTGSASSAGNALNINPLNEGTPSWGTDPDLETALGISNTMNATSIEFDFISAANQIEFNYLLASEEYLGDNPCRYSDGFAFLIKEAGTSSPYTNIAVIPGSSTPVNTTTIHPEIVGFCPAENPSYFDGYNIGDTNYNGRTKVLTATASITPNVAYRIKLVMADQGDENYDSAVFIQGNSFTATVDLGPDIVTCAQSVTLNGSIDNPLATYKWFRNGALISGATTPTLTVNNSGNYKVFVSVKLNSSTCDIEDDIVVTLNAQQSSANLPDYVLCDDISNNGKEFFDLSTRNAGVLQTVPPSTYNISYYLTSAAAQTGGNPITAPIQNTMNPQTIYIRIEDSANGCLSFSEVRLIVNQPPSITDPAPLVICDTDGNPDQFTEIDLTQVNSEIASDAPNLFVSYHFNTTDANSGGNPIYSPFTNINPSDILYVRVYDAITGCFSLTTLNVTVVNPPTIAIEKPYINACEEDANGFETFDLTSVINDVLGSLTGVTVSFYETIEDAEAGSNAINNSSNYQNITQDLQIVYLKIVDDVTGCFTIVPLELHSDITLSGFHTSNFNGCDDLSEDGIVDFDLYSVEATLLNGFEGFDVEFFESESDQQNSTNALDKAVPYTVTSSPKRIYATVISPDCKEFIDINLVINPPLVLPVFETVEYCDTDQDGFAEVFLPTFDDYVSEGINAAVVKYYETEDDAWNDENVLEPFVYNSREETLYVRVTNSQTSCYDVAPLTIKILDAPIKSGPDTIFVCDDDSDGYAFFNLESSIPNLVPDTTGLIITFHTNYNVALTGESPIEDPTNFYSQSQYIAVRIENENRCFAIAALYVEVNNIPEFTPISNFQNCESDGNQIADFYFYLKDEEILNGQTKKDVLYFRTAEDAENRVNIIDKFAPYQNVASPQTVYVRVEAITDPDCYGTSSFIIEVGSLPEFNVPEDIFICDDLSNDGIVSLDLSDKVLEISNGINETIDISLHTSYEDADEGINPITDLNYTNAVNPQPIYARIDNGTYCHSITKFSINVVQLPAVTTPSDLTACDTDSDGSALFDLTDVEIEVLDLRQDNIITTYHESLLGAETDSQIISDPENYANTSNPQTVYIKVNNTVSNCFVNLPITLKVNLPPAVNDFQEYPICKNPENSFDLTVIDTVITQESNITVSYYSSSNDALNNENQLNTAYTYITQRDTIYARLENTMTGCVTYYTFQLIVSPAPLAYIPNNLEDCDDDFDGILAFDLSQQTSTILGNQDPTIFSVSYHETQNNASSGTNTLEEIYPATDGQIIYARVLNTSTGCFNTTQFSSVVHPKPRVNISDQAICIDNLPLTVSANTNNPTDTYVWSTGITTPEIEIITLGSYSVTITNSFGCQTTEQFEVEESESATIEAIETIDFSDPNNITVTISGTGNYQYVLDDGPPQESNVFNNVTLGYHIITIIDLDGCKEITKEVVVIDAPKFVTPNNDGFFDTWHISGIETLPGSVINVFDRYGKLITTLTSTSKGWNGTYNGYQMPSSDYWFFGRIKKNDNVFEVKGHFALKL